MLPDMRRQRSDIFNTSFGKTKTISATMMRDVKEMLLELFDIKDVPHDEHGVIPFLPESFLDPRDYDASLNDRLQRHSHPDRVLRQTAICLMDDVLSPNVDNIVLIERVLNLRMTCLDTPNPRPTALRISLQHRLRYLITPVRFDFLCMTILTTSLQMAKLSPH